MEESSSTSDGYLERKDCFKVRVFSEESLAGKVSCHEEAVSDVGCDGSVCVPETGAAGATGRKALGTGNAT